MTKFVPSEQQHATAGPYSPVIEVQGKTLVVISGQAAIHPDGSLYADDLEVQTRATMEGCRERLAQAGCTFDNVFKVTVYLADLDDWPRFNEIYAEIMPRPFPVRTAIAAGLLHNFLVEIEMWAMKE